MKAVAALITLGLVLAAWLCTAAETRPARVGLLGPDEQPRFADIAAGLREGLRQQGYAEGRIEILETRVGRGDASARRAIGTIGEQQLAVCFVIGSNLARLARESAPELPIVFITPGDPVAAGMLNSFAHPGRNMTALTFEYPELSAKRLELLRDLVPGVRRVLVLYDPRDASPRQGVEAARAAAHALGITLVEVEVRDAKAISEGLKRLDEVDALLGVPGGITSTHYRAMIAAANARQRPTVVFTHSAMTRDALLSYGASDVEVAQQAARALAKVLKGARAGDLAVERPSKLTLVINVRTAKALGITLPSAVLLRADQLVE